ncbi:MAG: hypothetical protein ACE5FP_10190, partial [Gemmatimonadota bacterium]
MVRRVGHHALQLGGAIGLTLLAACGTSEGTAAGGGEATEITRTPPQLVVFAYDRSTSISDHQLDIARQL